MQNIIMNIKDGTVNSHLKKKGVELAHHIADENEQKTGNKTIVTRVLDYADKYDGHRREHYSFDIIEIVKD